MAASQNGHTEIVKLLLNRGAVIDHCDKVIDSNYTQLIFVLGNLMHVA